MPGFDGIIQPPGAGHVLAGRYRLVAPIARGGMAEVWEAHDEVLSRPVAAKVLQAHLAADGVFLERFRREAVTAARLAHPGIVATFDTGYDQGTAFIVMELVRGRNLRQWLDSYGRMEPWLAVAVSRQVADALAYAHQAGLVHRDVKPANILLIEDEWGGLRVKVTDFGIAKAGLDTGGGDLTRTGIVLGTPKYLSPEQLRGGDPDPRADLYALGVVLYETLVGSPPYVGETDMATALAHLGDKVPKPSASVRGLPSGLDRIVVDLLAKRPEDRIPTAMEVRRRLDGLGPLAPPTSGGAAAAGPAGSRGGGAPKHSRRKRAPGEQTPPGGWGTAVLAPAGAGPPGAGAAGAAPTVAVGAPSPSPSPAAAGVEHAWAPVGTSWPAPGATNGSRAPGHDATVVTPPPGFGRSVDGTDQYAATFRPRPVHRTGRITGYVVLALVAVGGLVAAGLLLTSGSKGHAPASAGNQAAPGQPVTISAVSVYMDNSRPPDDPEGAAKTHDGNPTTAWSTDQYNSPTFGNLYDGIGLEISLSSSRALKDLTVTSSTAGWSGSVYVSGAPVTTGQSVAAWGPAVASKTAINGSTTFNLGGHPGAYVLLWITNLGPADVASVAELSVTG